MTEGRDPQLEKAVSRRIAMARLRARLALLAERSLPHLIAPLCVLSLFLSAAWFGFFRSLPDWPRLAVAILLVFSFLASLLPLVRLRWPDLAEVDGRLEAVNRLPHQAIRVQQDRPVSDTPFARALWERHRARMAEKIGPLESGLPRPDISRFDSHGLRAVPALVFAIAAAYSLSGQSGRVADAFVFRAPEVNEAGLRVDVWVTPPSYTNKPAMTLAADKGPVPVPRFSQLSVRASGEATDGAVTYRPAGSERTVPLSPEKPASGPKGSPAEGSVFKLKLETDGELEAFGQAFSIRLIPDEPPRIAFDGKPRRTVTGALEIRFKAHDDYGIERARVDIVPLEQPPQARPLFPLPEFPLDLPARKAGDIKGIGSRNLTEHPLAGQRVRVTLLAEDAAGQTGRSDPIDMVMPARGFSDPLAAAIAEQRQIFSLDTRQIQRAIEYNDAAALRADETISNLSHFLLLKSARGRMALARDEASLKDAADYLWEIALGIDGGDLPMAERAVRDAQKALADALKRNAPDSEIQALMDNLRKAMKDYMQALAKRMEQQPQGASPKGDARNVIRQQDLEKMLNQLENMARSGNKDAAQQLLSEMQRLMNNLQAGNGQRQPSEAESRAREQVDKLGKILRDQQKLMEDTYKLNQELQQQQWQTDPGMPGEDEPLDPGSEEQATDPGAMTRKQQQDMQALQERQQQLEQQLKELGEGLKGLGMKPNKGLGDAGKEMEGAGKALGRGEGQPAFEGQGRALEALRKGAKEMMQSMAGQGQGEGQGMGQSGQGQAGGQDPLGRSTGRDGMGDYGGDKLPDTTDVQRARDILDAIRRKLGEGGMSPTGRQYLERLLNLD
ncbi:TIGR02302 family protein [Gellertiella hungarica]|uniref:Uncharacterized protein (TIGR02302 family) n=1 Tax=Gellertiella hungarica TaxID=1572859 RepID=A0A7W6J5G0_9HYPH|nr:TIGR02302 family protein [Gellertiella hungarica]MBB4065119.1 uncharacterized protein (TIGR02302 family) [Gellertiella hungarica]